MKGTPLCLSECTRDYVIEGMPGKWAVTDSCVFDGFKFYLLENQKHGERMERVVLSSDGKVICNKNLFGFDKYTLQKISEFIHACKEANTKQEGSGKRPSVRQKLREKLDIVRDQTNNKYEQ